MKKILNLAKNILLWLIILGAVLMVVVTVISATAVDRNDRSFLGYQMYIVTSDSMAATDFDAGSLIFCKKVSPATLKAGDIITFVSQNTGSFGEILTHKIRRLTTTGTGIPGFITYGTTTDTNDEAVVTYDNILGKYTGKVAGLGRFFNFLKTPTGYLLCIFLPFMLIIVYEGTRFLFLLRKYRQEQMEQVQAERDKVEKERAANEKLLEELKQLRAQLQATEVTNDENKSGGLE